MKNFIVGQVWDPDGRQHRYLRALPNGDIGFHPTDQPAEAPTLKFTEDDAIQLIRLLRGATSSGFVFFVDCTKE